MFHQPLHANFLSVVDSEACRTRGGLCRLGDVLPAILSRCEVRPENPGQEPLASFDASESMVLAEAMVC